MAPTSQEGRNKLTNKVSWGEPGRFAKLVLKWLENAGKGDQVRVLMVTRGWSGSEGFYVWFELPTGAKGVSTPVFLPVCSDVGRRDWEGWHLKGVSH